MSRVYTSRRPVSLGRSFGIGIVAVLVMGALFLMGVTLMYETPAQKEQRAASYDMLIPKGPVPFPKSPADQYSPAQRAAVIKSVSSASKNAEMAAGSGYEGQALHSWNQFFNTHNGIKHTD